MSRLTGGVHLSTTAVATAAPGTTAASLATAAAAVAANAVLTTTSTAAAIAVEYRTFDPVKYLTVGDNDEMKEYQSRRNQIKRAIKWGQFKLLIEEVLFFSQYWDPTRVKAPVVVYVGSAPGTHLTVLANMFPTFTFHLYDPRPHDEALKEFKNIHTHQQFFTDIDVKEYADRKDVYFISDIRSSDYNKTTGSNDANQINEDLVWQDMLRQQAWVKAIKPVRASLKFRLPYAYPSELAKGKTRPYLRGLAYRQAWAPQTSTETRLVPDEDLAEHQWDIKTYESMMFFHNTVVREEYLFRNPITGADVTSGDRSAIAEELGLGNDYDATQTAYTAQLYLRKYNLKSTANQVVALLKAMITGTAGGRVTLVSLRDGMVIPGEEADGE